MPDLIYMAAFVFSMMSIAVVLTILEFRKMQKDEAGKD
jgi:hypothetical protein